MTNEASLPMTIDKQSNSTNTIFSKLLQTFFLFVFLGYCTPMRAVVLVDSVPSRTYLHDFKASEVIEQMEVTIRTSSDIFSETENDVWLDVGPRAWRLFGKFQRGGLRTFNINATDIDPTSSACSQRESRLHVGDLVYFKIEKKGIQVHEVGGVMNGPDDPLEKLEPDSVRADRYLKKMGHAVSRSQSRLDALQDSMDAIQIVIDSFRTLDRRIGLIDYQLSRLPQYVEFVEKEIQHAKTVNSSFENNENVASYMYRDVKRDATVQGFALGFKQHFKEMHTREDKHIQGLEKERDTLLAQIRLLQKQKEFAANMVATMEKRQTELYCHRGSIELLIQNERNQESKLLTEYNPIADWAKNVLDALDEKDIPSKGQWKPEWMVVKINGRFFGKYVINERLKKGHAVWQVELDSALRWQDKLLRSLRTNPAMDKVYYSDEELTGMLRTPIKLVDTTHTQPIRVTGRIISKIPAYDAEGNALFSIFVENMNINGEEFSPDGMLLNKQRYIQVKCNSYKNKKAKKRYRLFRRLAQGTRVKVEGIVVRYHLKEGFWQVLPPNATHIKRLH